MTDDNSTREEDEGRGREVVTAVQFRTGNEFLQSISESEVEVPREGEMVRIGDYRDVEGEDSLLFDGTTYIVREVVHQYGNVVSEIDTGGGLVLVTITVVLEKLGDQ